ncbi:hypothetical protein [Mesorhizobium tamadayense]|uniref:hypothetical protein n=1 Tax=Mesorhizobium tamadayense TaxID=425306 RepID=UPI00198207EA|nr:hypothetical protein [Mesorhizobium tamadayense]
MSACVTFEDLTLVYNSHAAVHHLSGVVRRGSLTDIISILADTRGLLATRVRHASRRIA